MKNISHLSNFCVKGRASAFDVLKACALSVYLLCGGQGLLAQDSKLIDVHNLEQLNAIRYDLDGDGMADKSSRQSIYEDAFGGAQGTSSSTLPSCAASGVTDCEGYELMANLDFSDPSSYASAAVNTSWTTGQGWPPMGHNKGGNLDPLNPFDDHKPFVATFNGNRHTISHLHIDSPDGFTQGLFAVVGASGKIDSLGLLDVNIKAFSNAGGIAGHIQGDGRVTHSHVTGNVKGVEFVGGLVGSNFGLIKNSYSEAEVIDDQDTPRLSAEGLIIHGIGGLVGVNQGELLYCYATGRVQGVSQVGGLVGINGSSSIGRKGFIVSCYASGNVKATTGLAGGLVGANAELQLDQSTNIVALRQPTINLDCIIASSYATGSVEATSSGIAGGLVGANVGQIKACYATGTVTGKASGSLAGLNFSTIQASYAKGSVTGGPSGGLYTPIGKLISGDTSSWVSRLEIENSYFDSQTTGQNTPPESSKMSSALQSPTGYEGIYASWNINIDSYASVGDTEVDDPWSFGTSSEYPTLKADFDGDGTATVSEFGIQKDAAPQFYATEADRRSRASAISQYTAEIHTNTSGTIETPVIYLGDNEKEVLTLSISSSQDAAGNNLDYFEIIRISGSRSDVHNYQLQVKSTATLVATQVTLTLEATEATGIGPQDHTSMATVIVTITPSPVFQLTVPGSEAPLIYPNPTSGRIHIQGIRSDQLHSYGLYNVLGQSLLSGKTSIENNEIDLEGLSAGSYMLILSNEYGQESLRSKLIINK